MIKSLFCVCQNNFNFRDYDPGQQCCYGENGNIITGINGGTADLIAPTNWKTTIFHFLVDVYPWILCCTGRFKDCSRYTSRRPVDDCSDWPERPPPGNDSTATLFRGLQLLIHNHNINRLALCVVVYKHSVNCIVRVMLANLHNSC